MNLLYVLYLRLVAGNDVCWVKLDWYRSWAVESSREFYHNSRHMIPDFS